MADDPTLEDVSGADQGGADPNDGGDPNAGGDQNDGDKGGDDGKILDPNAGGDDGNGADDGGDKGSTPDWRTQFATDEKGEPDADVLKFLGRYHSPAAAIKAWKQTNDAMAKGEFLKPPGEDASDEELAAFRKALGVPEEAKDYLENLPDGLVIGEQDQPAIEKFLDSMHKSGARPADVNAALQAYYDNVAEQNADFAEQMAANKVASEENLRQEWGADYRRNLTAAKSFIETLPAEVQQVFSSGFIVSETADGKTINTAIGDNPDIIRWVTDMALQANPLATVVPGAGANQASAVNDEIAELEKMMANKGSDYWKGPKKDQLQARYRELVDARQRLSEQA